MNELQIKQLQLLNETIAHYNCNNRCSQNGTCQYSPIEGKSEGCAIGRLIEDKELCEKLDRSAGTTVKSIFIQLPAEIQEYGRDFLDSLQKLHDEGSFWNEKGLTQQGLTQVDYIKKIFVLEE